MGEQCVDNAKDRDIGEQWEKKFCALAADAGKMFTAHQIGRPQSAMALQRIKGDDWKRLMLPDITVWSAPGQHHEIKHKDAAKSGPRRGCFGLEEYRFAALLDFQEELGDEQKVYYTIHRHDWAGGRHVQTNDIRHWVTADVVSLFKLIANKKVLEERGTSWVNGKKTEGVLMYYWLTTYWQPLAAIWTPVVDGNVST